MKSAFGVVHKSDSTKHAAEVGAGVGGLATAATANRGITALQDRRAATWQKRRDKLHSVYGLDENGKPVMNPRGTYRGKTSPKVKSEAKASVKRKWTAINELNRKAKRDPIRRMGFRTRSAAVTAGLVGGTGLIWHGARSLQNDINKKANDVDYAVVGGITGAGAYQGGLYATKPLNRRWEKKIATEGDSKDTARLRAHRKASGVPKNAPAGHPSWEKYYRTYPKDFPGARFNRAMSYAHSGKTGVAATYGMAGAGALGALALKNRKKK